MDWQKIGVKTGSEAIEAVADVFCRLGAGGVVIEEPEALQKMAGSGLWDDYELSEERLNRSYSLVTGYLPMNEELPGRLDELREGLALIAQRLGESPYNITLATVREEDWANSWKAFFKPLKIGKRLVIRPSWEPYQAKKGEIVLEIDPGTAFGTGSHITTILCARALEKYVQAGMTVIDVGTGTGILAMSAARLGAKRVYAYDYDSVAVKVASENIKANGLEDKVTVACNDLLAGQKHKADLVAANIIAEVILKLLPQVPMHLNPGGLFIASGIISERKDEVLSAASELGFTLCEEKEGQGWVALVWLLKEC